VEESEDQPHLLAIAARELPQRPLEVGAKTPRQLLGPIEPVEAAEPCQERQGFLPAGALAVAEVAGQVADPAPDRDAVAVAVEAEDAGRAPARVQEVEQGPDRRRLARPIRPQKAKDLARLDRDRDVLDPPLGPLVLGQPLGLDRPHTPHPRTAD
jgi:hypothetical protein